MNNLLERETITPSHPSQKQIPAYRYLYLLIWITVIAALVAGIILLLSDIFPTILLHAPVSAAPLLLIGATYLGFQVLMRPKPLDLFKALIVSAAFLLWGVDQLLPTGWFATLLGDIVIVLYVIDLGWMMADRLQQHWRSHHTTSENERWVSSAQRDARTPLLPLGSFTPEEKRQASLPLILPAQRNSSFLKQSRLVPLPCTCDSPLAPLRSSTCCREMRRDTEEKFSAVSWSD
jgi:hypothetical protein